MLARNNYYHFGKQYDNPALTANLSNAANKLSAAVPLVPGAPATHTTHASNRYLFNGKEKQVTGNHGYPTYMVGGGSSFGAKVQRNIGLLNSGGGYPMGIYRNGRYVNSIYQNQYY